MIELKENYSLKSLNTFNIEAFSQFFYTVNSRDELKQLIDNKIIDKFYPNVFILSGGSNILFTKNVSGLTIHVETKGKSIIKKDNEKIWLKVEAGEDWHNFVIWNVENNYYGAENLALIPGKVGSSPIQNIGAYGVEVKDIIDEVEYYNFETKNIEIIKNIDCNFSYRNSIFKQELKGKIIILSVTFALNLIPNINISYGNVSEKLVESGIANPSTLDVCNAIIKIREEKLPDPDVIGNAGSFFKNPIVSEDKVRELLIDYPQMPYYKHEETSFKLAAGWLIDKCGFKGYKAQNVGVHDKQALILINLGNATGNDVLETANKIINDVKAKFGVKLQPEVNIM